MNAAPAESVANSRAGAPLWAWALVVTLISLAAITTQSLWIDEALTGIKAVQPTFAGWWQEMRFEKASDLQMPIYMIYVWGWVKVFGASEFALRAANVPWMVAGLTTFIAAVGGGRKIFLAVVAITSSFAWYYLDEARPYAMQLAASLIIFAALHRVAKGGLTRRSEGRWLAGFWLGVIALSGSSLLGMIWAGAAVLILALVWPRERAVQGIKDHALGIIVALIILAGIGGYYLWTLKVGARASEVGKTDVRNLGFIIYELFGFGGLGPGRLEIRDDGLKAFVPFAKQLVVYGVLVMDLMILGVWQFWRGSSRKVIVGSTVLLALPMLMILGAGLVEHFRVLGRHFTPLMAVVIWWLGVGLEARWLRRHWVSKPLAILFVVLSVASCLSYRFASRHAKDDYRGAAESAKTALQAGRVVWWNAGREGALYYQVPLEDAGGQPHAIWLMNPSLETIAALPAPDVIIASKPDVYDSPGALGDYLKERGYERITTLPAFTIWRRPNAIAKILTSPPAENMIE